MNKEKVFECTSCPDKFVYVKQLEAHYKAKHPVTANVTMDDDGDRNNDDHEPLAFYHRNQDHPSQMAITALQCDWRASLCLMMVKMKTTLIQPVKAVELT